jgi:hypothetical protein
MSDSKELKQTLIAQLPKIKTFLIGSDHQLFQDIKVSLTDWDSRNGLNMALITLRFETYSEPDMESFIGVINDINKKLNNLMDRIAFDLNGNLKPPKGDVVLFSGGMLVSDIIFSFRTDEVLTMEVDCMFHRNN